MGIQLEQNLKIDPTIQYQEKSEYTQNSTLDIRIVEIQNRLLSNELITLNRSKDLPSLNLVGTYGTTGFGYNGLPTSFLDFYTIGFAGLQLSQPLFNGTVSTCVLTFTFTILFISGLPLRSVMVTLYLPAFCPSK